jgi:predicted HAD superfamily Cof-like phosphohydrolase
VKSAHQRRIEEFMVGAKQVVPSTPELPSLGVRQLRANLILEEAFETIEALGFSVYTMEGLIGIDSVTLIPQRGRVTLEDIADGCADVSVVTIGTLSACGIADLPVLEEVDTNNLLKLKNGKLREDGKLLKARNHPKPEIRKAIGLP